MNPWDVLGFTHQGGFPSDTRPLGCFHALSPGRGCSSELMSMSCCPPLIDTHTASGLGRTKRGREGKQKRKGRTLTACR